MFEMTYRPARFEQGWLTDALGDFLADGTLTDVLFSVRGGKEAQVYACRGGPSTGGGLIAAKVYRPRKFRELRNDAMYREGRGLIDADGHGLRARDRRMHRAMRKGSRRGKSIAHTSWVMHEHDALDAAWSGGACVPRPWAASTNAVLMDFVGDERGAAPTLHRAKLTPSTAEALLEQILDDVEVLLERGLVHADLSPYNLLLWEERAWMIDLPQAVDVHRNPHGTALLRRDVTRVCDGLARCGAERRDAVEVADAMWDRVFDTWGGVRLGSVSQPLPPGSWQL